MSSNPRWAVKYFSAFTGIADLLYLSIYIYIYIYIYPKSLRSLIRVEIYKTFHRKKDALLKSKNLLANRFHLAEFSKPPYLFICQLPQIWY